MRNVKENMGAFLLVAFEMWPGLVTGLKICLHPYLPYVLWQTYKEHSYLYFLLALLSAIRLSL